MIVLQVSHTLLTDLTESRTIFTSIRWYLRYIASTVFPPQSTDRQGQIVANTSLVLGALNDVTTCILLFTYIGPGIAKFKR